MRRIPQRELRNSSGKILAEVAAGETIEVTSNGRVMAVMVPPKLDPVERGLRDGTVIPATSRKHLSDLPRVTSDISVQEALDELREDKW